MRRPSVLSVYCYALLFFLFAPVLTILVFSFDASGRGTLPLEELSFKWYDEVVSSSLLREAFKNSAIVGVSAAVLALALGSLAAFGIWRRRSRLNLAVIGLAVVPIALPPLVLGIALLSLFNATGITLSLQTVVVAHVLLTTPFVLLTVYARLANVDPAIEEAARDLGATRTQTFRRVTFPLIRVSLFGAGLLVLALSLDEFIVTLLTIGPDNTVPVVIWGQMRRGISPSVNAISAILLLLTVLIVWVTSRLTGAAITPVDNE